MVQIPVRPPPPPEILMPKSRHRLYKLPSSFLEDDQPQENGLVGSLAVLEKNLRADNLAEYPSKVLSNMFAAHPKLCDKKFELKINDVRFVGHPISLEVKPGEQRNFPRDIRSNITMFQVRKWQGKTKLF